MKTLLLLTFLVACSTNVQAEEKGKGKHGKAHAAKHELKKRDANNDGSISKEEFLAGAKDAARAEKIFAKLDRNGDGAISKDDRNKKDK
jgi:Ca2+-binding EF-hand superfamily protein